MNSAACRQYLCHTLILVCCKYRFCPTNLSIQGYNRSRNISTKHCCFVIVRAISLQRQRLHEIYYTHSIHSSFTRGKFYIHAIFLWSLVLPERLLNTWPPILTCMKLTWTCKWTFYTLRHEVQFIWYCIKYQSAIRLEWKPRLFWASTVRWSIIPMWHNHVRDAIVPHSNGPM